MYFLCGCVAFVDHGSVNLGRRKKGRLLTDFALHFRNRLTQTMSHVTLWHPSRAVPGLPFIRTHQIRIVFRPVFADSGAMNSRRTGHEDNECGDA